MSTMACGSIIVTHLYEKLQIEKLDVPHELLEVNQKTIEGMDDRTLLNKCILLWNGIESYYGFYNHSIHYEKDDHASATFYKVAGKYYATYYNYLMNHFNDKLTSCRKESSEYNWTVNLIRIYSEYYLMRQNLLSHIRYLYKINPRLIGMVEGVSINIETLLPEPEEFHIGDKPAWKKILDIGVYCLWVISNI